jgi:ADP-heptose:LPS heptosyltransferase
MRRPTIRATTPSGSTRPRRGDDHPTRRQWSRQIAAVRAVSGVGEMLCVIPALRSLRQGRPDTRITMVGLEQAKWLAERRPDLVDDWVDLPHWPGVRDACGEPADTVALLSSALPAYDLVVQLHGPGGPVNRLAQLLSAGSTVVHVDNRVAHPEVTNAPRWLTPPRTWPRLVERTWPATGHEVDRLLGLVTSIGCPDMGRTIDLPEQPDDIGQAASVWRRLGCRRFVVVAPTSPFGQRETNEREWSVDGFAAVARGLVHDGWAVVVIGGGASREPVASVAVRCEVPVIPALDLPLGGLSALLRRASALVAGDHELGILAQAVGCPVALIGSSFDVERWGPLDCRHGRVRASQGSWRADSAALLSDVRAVVRRAPTLTRGIFVARA